MKHFKVPTDFIVQAKDEADLHRRFQDFMRFCMNNYGQQFGILDWELPVEYPVEEIKQGECCG